MKIKLIIIDSFDPPGDVPAPITPLRYFIDSGHLDHWFILLLYQTKRSKLSLHKIIFSKAKEEPQRFLFFILC